MWGGIEGEEGWKHAVGRLHVGLIGFIEHWQLIATTFSLKNNAKVSENGEVGWAGFWKVCALLWCCWSCCKTTYLQQWCWKRRSPIGAESSQDLQRHQICTIFVVRHMRHSKSIIQSQVWLGRLGRLGGWRRQTIYGWSQSRANCITVLLTSRESRMCWRWTEQRRPGTMILPAECYRKIIHHLDTF